MFFLFRFFFAIVQELCWFVRVYGALFIMAHGGGAIGVGICGRGVVFDWARFELSEHLALCGSIILV